MKTFTISQQDHSFEFRPATRAFKIQITAAEATVGQVSARSPLNAADVAAAWQTLFETRDLTLSASLLHVDGGDAKTASATLTALLDDELDGEALWIAFEKAGGVGVSVPKGNSGDGKPANSTPSQPVASSGPTPTTISNSNSL